MKRQLFILFLPLTLCCTMFGQNKPAKLSVEAIVAKHLLSIGPTAVLASNRSRVLVGDGRLSSKVVTGNAILDGPSQLASAGDKVLFAMIFQNPSYPYEKAAFDGQDQTVGVPSGRKTLLAEFLRAHGAVLKDGLFTGALSTAWPLLDLGAHSKVKLEYGGTTNIDDRPCYKIKYSSSRTGELKVTFYFDAENFHHLRTEYSYSIEPGLGASPTDRSRDSVEYYELIENFSDFRTAGQLTLPFSYTINVTTQRQVSSAAGPQNMDWTVKIKQVYFDEPLAAEVFKVS